MDIGNAMDRSINSTAEGEKSGVLVVVVLLLLSGGGVFPFFVTWVLHNDLATTRPSSFRTPIPSLIPIPLDSTAPPTGSSFLIDIDNDHEHRLTTTSTQTNVSACIYRPILPYVPFLSSLSLGGACI